MKDLHGRHSATDLVCSGRSAGTQTCKANSLEVEDDIQSNPLNGTPDNGSVRLIVQDLAGPIL